MDEEDKGTVTMRGLSLDEEGKKWVEKVEVDPDNLTPRYIEKKIRDKRVQRMDRHPKDGLFSRDHAPPKSGHGGKFTWEGPDDINSSELNPVPPAIDPKDPNYVDDDDEVAADEQEAAVVVGEVEVAKMAKDGVSRIEFLLQ